MSSVKIARVRGTHGTRRARKKAYHHGNLRPALLEAAARLLATKGQHAVTLRAVARAAGVSEAAPYRHFRDKRAMLAAVAAAGFRDLARTLRRAAERGRDRDPGSLAAMAQAYVRFAEENPALYRVMLNPTVTGSDYPELGQAAREGFGVLVGTIADFQRGGALREGAPQVLAFVVFALVHGIADLVVERQVPREARAAYPPGRLVAAALQILHEGLGPRSGKPRG